MATKSFVLAAALLRVMLLEPTRATGKEPHEYGVASIYAANAVRLRQTGGLAPGRSLGRTSP